MHLKALKTPLLCLLATGLTGAFVGQANAAGAADATSGYLTIQPDGAGNTVYTFSWVARDTDNNSTGVTYTDTGTTDPFGNGTASIDRTESIFGGNYTFDNTANGGSATTTVRYASGSTSGNGYESDNVPVNTTTWVNYQDPLDTTVGGAGVSVATPKFDSSGNWTKVGSAYYASGIQGTTGVFGLNPDGSDALAAGAAGAVHQGVGFGHDTDGANDATGVDDFGVILAGYDYVLDPSQSNVMPNTGYVQVVVPDPTFTTTSFADRFNEGVFTNNAAVEITVTSSTSYVPKLAVSGDFDSDFDVDATDLLLVTDNYWGTGLAGFFYADGDTDADGDVDNADIGVVIGAVTPSVSSGSADLTYDTVTGNVKLDASSAAGAIITSFQLENGAGTFVFNNYAGLFSGDFGFIYEDVSGSVLGDSDPSLDGFSGIVDIGDVFPAGMDLAGLQSYLTTAVFTGEAGSGQQEFNLVVTGVVSTEYETWADGSNFEDDDNNDGVENGLAFILGAADPDADATSLLPVEGTEPGFLTLTFNRVNPIGDVVLSVDYSGDLTLTNSDVIPAASDTLTSGVVVQVTSPGAPDPDTVVVKIPDSFESAVGSLFARLKATEN